MNTISKKEKKILIILIIFVIVVFLVIAGFAFTMFIGYNARSNWNAMMNQENVWHSNNSEIVFSKTEYRFDGPDIYTGSIKNKNITVEFGFWEDNDKTISFYDSESKELLVKADVKSYSEEKFKIKITKDEIGLSEDKYTFVPKSDSKSLV